MKRIILAAAAIAVISTAAHAADKDGLYRSKGIGLESCRSWLAAADKKTAFYTLSLAWLNGYVSALNKATPATYDVAGSMSIVDLARSLAGYCKAEPNSTIVAAVERMTDALAPKRFQTQAEAESAGPKVSRATLIKAQEALKKAGLYKGAIDGLDGSGTETAIAAFQKLSRLPVTGELDKATQAKLLAN